VTPLGEPQGGHAREPAKKLFLGRHCFCLTAIISKRVHRRVFVEIDDPESVLNGLSENSTPILGRAQGAENVPLENIVSVLH